MLGSGEWGGQCIDKKKKSHTYRKTKPSVTYVYNPSMEAGATSSLPARTIVKPCLKRDPEPNTQHSWAIRVYTLPFNPSIQEAEAEGTRELEASLGYILSMFQALPDGTRPHFKKQGNEWKKLSNPIFKCTFHWINFAFYLYLHSAGKFLLKFRWMNSNCQWWKVV